MGNSFVTMKDIFERNIKLSWYLRYMFKITPRDLIEKMWREVLPVKE